MTNQPQHHIDPIFKEVLTQMGQRHNFTPETEVEVSFLPRAIDVIIKLPNPADRQRLAEETSFIRLRAHNDIEFKGRNDKLNLSGYQAIRGRLQFYLSQHNLNLADLSLSIVCAAKPKTLLNNREITFTPLEAGYYLSDEHLPSLIIVVNELPPIPKHYPLLLFASSVKKFREVIRQILQTGAYRYYLEYAYYVREEETLQEVNTMLQRKRKIKFETLYEFIRLAKPEWADEYDTLKETAQEQEMIAKQNEVIAKQNEERIKQEQELARQTQRRTLLRTLDRFFGEIPAALRHRIESTDNAELLDQWLDAAFEATSLAEFEAKAGIHEETRR